MLTLAFKAVNYDFMLVAVKSPRPPSAAMTAERDPITYIYITNDDLPTLVQSAVYNHISISSLGFGTTKGYVRKLRGHSSPTIESVSANTPCFLDKLALAVGAHFGSGFDAPEFKAAFSAALQRIAIQMQHRKASGGPYLDTGAAAKMLRSLAARSLVGYAEFRTFIGEAAITLLHGRSFTALWDGHEKRVHLDQDGLYRCRWSPIHPSPFAPVYQQMPIEGANVQNGSFNNMDGIGQLSRPSVEPAMPSAPVYQQMPIEDANVQNGSFNNVDGVGQWSRPSVESAMPFAPVHQGMPGEGGHEQIGFSGSLYDVDRRVWPPVQSPQDLHHPANGYSVDREMSDVDDGVNMGLVQASNESVGE